MNRERAKELLPIIQAFAEGKEIEFRYVENSKWRRAGDDVEWIFSNSYRIKPEPFECWVSVDGDGAVAYIQNEPREDLIHMREVNEET